MWHEFTTVKDPRFWGAMAIGFSPLLLAAGMLLIWSRVIW